MFIILFAMGYTVIPFYFILIRVSSWMKDLHIYIRCTNGSAFSFKHYLLFLVY